MVGIKLAIVLFVIVVGAFYINPANWHPFAPFGYDRHQLLRPHRLRARPTPDGTRSACWPARRSSSSPTSASTRSRPTPRRPRNPQRDVPIGIIASLLICTVLYIAVVGRAHRHGPLRPDRHQRPGLGRLRAGRPAAGRSSSSPSARVAGITSVLLVMMLSQPRVLLAMARDGLLPPGFFGAVHAKFRTPWKSTILTGFFVALMAALAAAAHPGRAGEHRHAAGLRHRLRGRADHAAHAPRGRAAVPRAVRPARADPRHPHLPAADVLAAGRRTGCGCSSGWRSASSSTSPTAATTASWRSSGPPRSPEPPWSPPASSSASCGCSTRR